MFKKNQEKTKETKETNEITDITDFPEKYLEINIIKKDKFRMVETIYEFIDKKGFEYDGKKYNIDSKCIFIIPNNKSFLQTSYYVEGNPSPLDFSNRNVGIPCNALSLLWKYKLYKHLMELEEKNINFILIILLLASMVLYGVGLYFHYNGGF